MNREEVAGVPGRPHDTSTTFDRGGGSPIPLSRDYRDGLLEGRAGTAPALAA